MLAAARGGYVDDIKTPMGCGTFEADFTPDALYRQRAGAAQQTKTDGVGTISHYSGDEPSGGLTSPQAPLPAAR